MSDAERIKFWTQHAIGSEADREYLAASVQAQISIALSLERIAEALKKEPEHSMERFTESPVYAELQKAGMIATPAEQAAQEAEAQVHKWAEGKDFHAPPVSPVGDVLPPVDVPLAADGVCNRCGREKEHMAHHY